MKDRFNADVRAWLRERKINTAALERAAGLPANTLANSKRGIARSRRLGLLMALSDYGFTWNGWTFQRTGSGVIACRGAEVLVLNSAADVQRFINKS